MNEFNNVAAKSFNLSLFTQSSFVRSKHEHLDQTVYELFSWMEMITTHFFSDDVSCSNDEITTAFQLDTHTGFSGSSWGNAMPICDGELHNFT